MTSNEIQQLRSDHIRAQQRAASRFRGFHRKLRRRARRSTRRAQGAPR